MARLSLSGARPNIAMRARCNVTPVLIREDIDIRPFIAEAGSSVLAARRFTDYLQDYFTQEKICHGIG
jgi:hypothetical protein